MRILLSFFIRALLFIMSGFQSRARQKYLSLEMLSRREGCLDERATPRAHRRTRTRTHAQSARARTTRTTHTPTHTQNTHVHTTHTHTHTHTHRCCGPVTLLSATVENHLRIWNSLEQPMTIARFVSCFVCDIRHARSPTITGRHCLRRQRGVDRRLVEVPSSFSPASRPSTFNDASFPNPVDEHLSSRLDW